MSKIKYLYAVYDTAGGCDLPLCIGSAQEVADYLGISKKNVMSRASHAEQHGWEHPAVVRFLKEELESE